MDAIELTYLQGVLSEFNKCGVALNLYEFNNNHINYGFYNGCRSVKYSQNIDLDNQHEFREELLRQLYEFVSDWR